MPHPLTDAELHDKFNGYREEGWCNSIYAPDDMRAAADWQLKQVKLTGQCVINELHENNCHIEADHAAAFLEVLIEAMRPTQENNS